jgi:hypothetical protein
MDVTETGWKDVDWIHIPQKKDKAMNRRLRVGNLFICSKLLFKKECGVKFLSLILIQQLAFPHDSVE